MVTFARYWKEKRGERRGYNETLCRLLIHFKKTYDSVMREVIAQHFQLVWYTHETN
jgi:hypothetical protein